MHLRNHRSCFFSNREIKFDVTWSYVKRQTAKMTSEFAFFSPNPSLNHIKIEKCLLLIATNTNIFTLLFNELKTDGKSFIFAVSRLTYDHVTSNLTSLLFLDFYLVCKAFNCVIAKTCSTVSVELPPFALFIAQRTWHE